MSARREPPRRRSWDTVVRRRRPHERCGWDEAIAGAEVVVHTASPFPDHAARHPEDLIAPARDGTCASCGRDESPVARVVLTSSTVAIFYPSGRRQGMSIRKRISRTKRGPI